MEETLARAAEPSGAWADIALENPVEARVPKVQISQAKGQSYMCPPLLRACFLLD